MNAKISRLQLFLIIPNLIFAKAVGITVGVVVRNIGGDTWTSMLIGFLLGVLVALVMVYICSKFPDKTIVQFLEAIFGKWIGKVLTTILFLYFSVAFGVSATVMILHIKEYFLVETPLFVVCLAYVLLCTYGVYLGIEVVIRYAMISLIMSVAINVTMLTGTMNDFKLIYLLPLFDHGILKNIENSYYVFMDISMPILSIGFLFPLLDNKKGISKVTLGAMLFSILLVIPWPMFETGVMGSEVMKHYVVVCMQQIRCAQLTRYMPRYELIMVSFFFFGMLVQSVTMFYCSVISFKQVTGIKRDWVVILPQTIVLLVVTYFLSYDHNRYINFLGLPWSQICLALSIGFPLMIIITAFFSGKLKSKSN